MGDFIAPWNLLQLTLIAIYPMYLSFFRIANGKYIYDWLVIYRITAVLKVETDIIASIAASPTGQTVIIVIMYVKIFKTGTIVLSVT